MLLNIVYSTNPDYKGEKEEKAVNTPPPGEQQLKVFLDTKHRKGKKVTIIDGFVGAKDDLKKLGKTLKKKFGVGGSAKEGQILIQGDYRQNAIDLLKKMGYQIR